MKTTKDNDSKGFNGGVGWGVGEALKVARGTVARSIGIFMTSKPDIVKVNMFSSLTNVVVVRGGGESTIYIKKWTACSHVHSNMRTQSMESITLSNRSCMHKGKGETKTKMVT